MDALTAKEVAAVFGIPELRVRKELERGVLPKRKLPRFTRTDVVYLRVEQELGLDIGVADRKRLYKLVAKAVAQPVEPEQVELGKRLVLKLGDQIREVAKRFDFAEWRSRLTIDPNILGGEPAFPGTRLAVRNVGGQLNRGVSRADLLEDYPYLTETDLDYALVYTQAHPRRGRPRARQATPR
ncbi:MAG: DUF433 domain-containing protein [Polyangiaceae bacterium]|nr:DUF433 domain-containing protein [Polyangiaceae bacterium]